MSSVWLSICFRRDYRSICYLVRIADILCAFALFSLGQRETLVLRHRKKWADLGLACARTLICVLVIHFLNGWAWAWDEPLPLQGSVSSSQGVSEKGRPQWINLEPGLDFCEFQLNDKESMLTAVRIDPLYFDFVLGARSADGKEPRTLDAWATEYDLAAAINASMYLPDNSTSTGYMRSGAHINNPRIVERFGAFFVADPNSPGFPGAMIVDRDQPDWRQILDKYNMVIQNYRMTNSQRKILWTPGGPLYSISAVAQDGEGRILFLHSRKPVEAYSFVQQLLHLPLDVRTVMYVEGGAQAGLVVHTASLKRHLAGTHAPSLLVTGNLKAVLPNILGARRKPAASSQASSSAPLTDFSTQDWEDDEEDELDRD